MAAAPRKRKTANHHIAPYKSPTTRDLAGVKTSPYYGYSVWMPLTAAPLMLANPLVTSPCCLNVKSEEERVVYKELNSTGTLIQKTTMEAPHGQYVLHRLRCS